jgi:hypothetical protein
MNTQLRVFMIKNTLVVVIIHPLLVNINKTVVLVKIHFQDRV